LGSVLADLSFWAKEWVCAACKKQVRARNPGEIRHGIALLSTKRVISCLNLPVTGGIGVPLRLLFFWLLRAAFLKAS
jgi:hypothetical protein